MDKSRTNAQNPAEDAVYTHDLAAEILEMVEDVLDEYDITVPSPEDDERGEDNGARLYGSVYSNLADSIEAVLIDVFQRARDGAKLVSDEFSGDF